MSDTSAAAFGCVRLSIAFVLLQCEIIQLDLYHR